MKLYQTIAARLEQYAQLIADIKGGRTPALCVGLSAIHKAHFVAAAVCDLEEPVLAVTPDEMAAARLAADVNAMLGEGSALVFPYRDFSYRQMEGVSTEYEQARLGVLSRIAAGEAKLVVASIQAVMSRTIPKQALLDNTLRSARGTPCRLRSSSPASSARAMPAAPRSTG